MQLPIFIMKKKQSYSTRSLRDFLWDIFCIASLLGIWPRFIEPRLISTTKLSLPIPHLPEALHGFKILQLSDLHLNPQISDSFLEKLVYKIKNLQPDLIVFTGDFLCYSLMQDPTRLRTLLRSFSAPYGCYAILGNHDYAECVSINKNGEYDVIEEDSSSLGKAFKRMFTNITLKKTVTQKAQKVPLHAPLIELLSETPFRLLHNQTIQLTVNGSKLNICGLGEYMLGRFHPEEAFKNYERNSVGIVLLHNPDAAPHLKCYPGELILCGHTHGGQVNLPWLWKKFTLLENMGFKKGLIKLDKKWVYINRGIGSIIPFRWFSVPELLLVTLEKNMNPDDEYATQL